MFAVGDGWCSIYSALQNIVQDNVQNSTVQDSA
jgi:hypothetical protein